MSREGKRARRKRVLSYHREKFLGVDITVVTVHYDPEVMERMRAWIAEKTGERGPGPSDQERPQGRTPR